MNTKIITDGKVSPLVSKNLSLGKPMHVQYNNLYHPSGACGATSAANAIVSAETPFAYNKKYQLEDVIMYKLMSKSARRFLQGTAPGAKYNPWNASVCIIWAVNSLAGKNICELQENNLAGIIYNLAIKNNPIVLGGAFTPSRHFVCTVGFNTAQTDILQITGPQDIELQWVKSMIIDDSWGNYLTNYKSKDGNNNILPIDIYKKIAMDGKRTKTTQVYFYQGVKG